MIKCINCEQYRSGVCPIGNPYRQMDNCIFKSEIKVVKEEGKKEMAITFDKKPDVLVRRKDQAMLADFTKGMTTSEIATKYKVHSATVRRALRNQGVDLKEAKELSKDIELKIVNELKAGAKVDDLVERYGLTRYKIKKVKGKYGLIKERPVKEDAASVKVEKVEEVEVVPVKVLTFFIEGDLLKPFEKAYPAEYDKRLSWAIDISSLDDLETLIAEADGSLVIDGKFIDIVPVKLGNRTGGAA